MLEALDKARKSIDIVVFRLDIKGVVDGLGAAVKRGVAVRALIAHTNRGAEKALRKLEARLLDLGVTVARTADDLVRYHGKMLIVDGKKLHVHGFNFTWRDVDQSRSFGIVISAPSSCRKPSSCSRPTCDRQPYTCERQRSRREPRERADAADRVHQGRQAAAPRLRPEGVAIRGCCDCWPSASMPVWTSASSGAPVHARR